MTRDQENWLIELVWRLTNATADLCESVRHESAMHLTKAETETNEIRRCLMQLRQDIQRTPRSSP